MVRHLAPPLENLFLLRRLRTRAIEGERSRISRDIHDGILQTLLSVDIQLDVLRRKLPQAPEQVGSDLGTLQQTVRNETAELRRMVTDMRPLGVQSADLVDLMRGFARALSQRIRLGARSAYRCRGAAIARPAVPRIVSDLSRSASQCKKTCPRHACRGKTVAK